MQGKKRLTHPKKFFLTQSPEIISSRVSPCGDDAGGMQCGAMGCTGVQGMSLNVSMQLTMPRNIAKGDERVAQRLRVLAHKADNPEQGPRQIGRALNIHEATVRGILKGWTADDAVSSNLVAHKGSGRPCKKNLRWRRYIFASAYMGLLSFRSQAVGPPMSATPISWGALAGGADATLGAPAVVGPPRWCRVPSADNCDTKNNSELPQERGNQQLEVHHTLGVMLTHLLTYSFPGLQRCRCCP